MMTPREILLEAHRAAEPRLDELREDVLAAEFAARSPQPVAPRPNLAAAFALKIWGELIWPSRRAWAALAAVWVVLGVVYLTSQDGGGLSSLTLSPPNVRRFAAWGEQQHLLTLTFANPPSTEENRPTPVPAPEKSAAGARPNDERWAFEKTSDGKVCA